MKILWTEDDFEIPIEREENQDSDKRELTQYLFNTIEGFGFA